MYSDRVDSVTRATNPSLLPSLPSTPRAHLVRRPPPPPPPPVLGISQCIDVYKPPRLAVEFSLRRSFLSFSLFLVTYILSLPSMPIPRALSPFPPLLTHRVPSDFSAPYPSPAYPDVFSVSLPLFRHLTLSSFPSCLAPSLASFSLPLSISLYASSSLT